MGGGGQGGKREEGRGEEGREGGRERKEERERQDEDGNNSQKDIIQHTCYRMWLTLSLQLPQPHRQQWQRQGQRTLLGGHGGCERHMCLASRTSDLWWAMCVCVHKYAVR